MGRQGAYLLPSHVRNAVRISARAVGGLPNMLAIRPTRLLCIDLLPEQSRGRRARFNPCEVRMRLRHIALLKNFCLLLVIILHCFLFYCTPGVHWQLHAAESLPALDALSQVFGFLVIPAFIFASGMLFGKSVDAADGMPRLLLRRARRLLLPWLCVALFWNVPLYTLFNIPAYMHPAGASLGEAARAALLGRFADHLWFLLVLFWATLFWGLALPRLDSLFRDSQRSCWPALAGGLTALGAALAVQNWGQIPFYCFGQSAGPIVYFYAGLLAWRHRERLDAGLRARPVSAAALLSVFIVLLWPQADGGSVRWLESLLFCLLAYQFFLLTAEGIHQRLHAVRAYAWFERHAFQIYLFHMPTPLLVFMALHPLGMPPWLLIPLNVGITLAATAAVIRCGVAARQLWTARGRAAVSSCHY